MLLAAAADGQNVRPLPRPRPRPPAAVAPPQDGVTDLSKAIPAKRLSSLPSTADQYHELQQQIGKDKPAFDEARQRRDQLDRETETLQRDLVQTAKRVLTLEADALRLGGEISRLNDEQDRLSRQFSHDRGKVVRLLAVLQRMQHSAPPAMALNPGDALSAARGTMLMGTSLPTLYKQAAELAKTIERLRKTKRLLVERRTAAARNAAQLSQARRDMARLLAAKRVEADSVAGRVQDLSRKLTAASSQAINLEMLLKRTRALQATPGTQGVVVVDADGTGPPRESLAAPVAGKAKNGGIEGVGGAAAPGLTYETLAGAQVVAPADGTVRYAGPYHQVGQALILRFADGYDAILVGFGRLDVRLGDHVLAGEPVGRMPETGGRQKLYFELRHNERGMNPAPLIAGSGKTR